MFDTDSFSFFGFYCRGNVEEGFLVSVLFTSLISFTAEYESIGMPTVFNRTSTMIITGFAMEHLKISLISPGQVLVTSVPCGTVQSSAPELKYMRF